MDKNENNYAFIDGQNTYLGIKFLGWKIDWKKFRIYLKDKYSVQKAFIFVGYVSSNINLYEDLQKSGFIIIFKPTILDSLGRIKGNCDSDLVLHSLIEKDNYNKAIIVTSDGDFYSLVRYLYREHKLKAVLSSHIKNCSKILKKEAREKMFYLNDIKNKICK